MINKLENFSAWVVLLSGWQRLFVAFFAGAFSSFSMAPFDVFPILFVTLPIFIWLIDSVYSDAFTSWLKTARSIFALGWWFGFGYFVAGLWWIGNALLIEADSFAWALPLAIVALPAFLAIFWGFATLLMRIFWRENWGRILTLALGLGAFEFLRGYLFTGFPWNTLGYAAMPSPMFMQSANIIGVYGATPLAIIVFATPLIALTTGALENKNKKAICILALVLALSHIGYGFLRMQQNPTEFVEGPKLRIVQPDIPQADKLSPAMGDKTVQTYLDISSKEPLDGITHLLWPESAFPFLLTDRRDVLSKIADLLPSGTQLLTGVARAEPSSNGDPYGRVYNSIYSIDDAGQIIAAADKVHLVPFGEFLPLKNILEMFGLEQLARVHGGFVSGSDRKNLDGGVSGLILPLICYEIIFSGEALNESQPRPNWIFNATNDAWYGNTPGPYQHARQSIIRGIETGLPVVRVANNGVSFVTDSYGRIVDRLGYGKQGVFDSQLPKRTAETLFAVYGHSIFYGILLLLMVSILAINFSTRHTLKH